MKSASGAVSSTAPPSRTAPEASARTRSGWYRRLRLPALIAFLAAAFGLLFVQTPWYQERRLKGMSLPALEREWRVRGNGDPRLLYYLGLRLNQQGHFAAADPILRQAVGLTPDSPRLRDEWARALLGSGRTTAAFGELRQFAGTHPHSAPAHLLLGKFYVTQNSMNRAIEELNRAVQLDPALFEGWAYLAVAHDALRNYPQAKEAAEKAAALRPRDFGSRLQLALQRVHAGETEGARQAFAQAIALGPGSPVAHREYAQWLLQAGSRPGDRDLALAEARRAVALDARDAGAQMTLGRACVQQGQLEAAVEPFRQAAALAPEYPASALAVAQTLARLGRKQESRAWMQVYAARQRRFAAKARLQAQLELNPKDGQAHRRLARLLAEEGSVEGCVRHQAGALHKPPDSAPALTAAANDLVATGHAQEALPLAKRAIEIAPHSPDALETLGDTLLGVGQPREAAAYYDRARTYRPERFQMYCDRIARFFRQQRERAARQLAPAERAYRASRQLVHAQVGPIRITPEAIRLAQKAVALEPTNPTYLRHLMMLQFDKRHDTEAIAAAEHLLAIAPNDTRAHALLAILLVDRANSLQELDSAEAHLKIAATDPSAEATWRYGTGLLALKRGENALAARELQRALELDPDATVTYYKLALAQSRAGQKEAAAHNLAIFREREAQKRAEADALYLVAAQPEDPARYRRAAALFDAHGRHEQAEAIRAAARKHFSAARSAASP
ncbi:MAG TPA: tetratricopeptide repeat protein [Chthonomonadaceae bacterium]|nr:tetratricopeptide repeat protein [Chthonomonadaceae bacterium]